MDIIIYSAYFFFVDWPHWDDSSGISYIAREINEWSRTACFCKCYVPIKHLTHAPKGFRCRELDMDHAQELSESFCETGSVNLDSISVTMDDEIWQYLEDNRKTLTWEELLGATLKKNRHPWMMGGNHTLTALGINRTKFPSNKMWTKQMCKNIVIKNDAEGRRMCRLYANLLNRKHIQKVTEWNEAVIQLHDNAIAEVQALQRYLKGQKRSAKFCNEKAEPIMLDIETAKMLQADIVAVTKFSANSVGAYWQLAQRGGDIWDSVAKLLTPKPAAKSSSTKGGKVKTAKVPGSSVFCQMGGLPDDFIREIMLQFAGGLITDKEFTQKCIHYKAIRRLRQYVFFHVSTCLKSNPDWLKSFPNWKNVRELPDMTKDRLTEMRTVFPAVMGKTFEGKWLPAFVLLPKKVGSKASEEFYSEISAVVNDEMNKKLKQVTSMNCFFI
jgi:hypothetical protein